MHRILAPLLSVVAATAATLVLPVPAASAARADPAVDLPRPATGRTALRLLGDRVDEAASLNGLATDELEEVLRTDPTAWLTTGGRLHYKEELAPDRTTAPAPAAAAYPLADTFGLHSKPGSQHTIFIDVDGASVSGTAWHASYPTTPTVHPAWDPAGDGPAFSDTERATVQELWQRVAEDYAPFDVDVTTQDPGAAAILRSSSTDPTYGAHAVVSPSGAWASLCDQTCGGVAFVDVLDQPYGPGGDGYGYYQPAWIFPQGTGNSAKNVAEALSHEVGHQLGLSHDGNATEGYDVGHGGWAPIMGASYYEPISQWSKGDYTGANNHENDVAVISAIFGVRADEAPAVVLGAPEVPTGTAYVSGRTDVDTFALGSCSGAVTVTATPAFAANLDVQLRLLDAFGAVVETADPGSAKVSSATASGMGASITRTVGAGTFYVAVDGVGRGTWSTGYDDYGSLGAYTVGVSGGCVEPGTPGAPLTLLAGATTASSAALTWLPPLLAGSSAVTGYVLTRSGSADEVTLGAGATSYTWSGLAASTSYTFTVAAVNAAGRGLAATTTATTTTPVPAPTTTTLAAVVSGRTVALTATVTGTGDPVGSVQLREDGVVVGLVPVGSGTASLTRTLVRAGTRSYDAAFVPADSVVAPSTAVTVAVTVAPTPTTTSLTTSVAGSTVTLDATVAAAEGTPSGTVELREGASVVGSVPVAVGPTVLVLTGVAPGAHTYRARFVPDGGDQLGSTSPDAAAVVASAPAVAPVVASQVALGAPRRARAGTRPTVRVRVVRGTSPAAGTVILTYARTTVTLVLRDGSASARLPRLRPGTVRLVATYAGDATTTGSSATAAIRVRKR